MAKDKAAASATATLFIQQTTLTEQAQEIVTAVANELQADSWEFKEGKADITAPLSAAWTKQMAAIGVTDEQSANVVIAASDLTTDVSTNFHLLFKLLRAVGMTEVDHHFAWQT
jgi:hydroxylamine reductase (hybrid-cluster protein)